MFKDLATVLTPKTPTPDASASEVPKSSAQSKSKRLSQLRIANCELRIASLLAAIAIALPGRALEVRITPDDPQLGDTLSVVVTTEREDTVPVVTFGDETYPAFPTGPRLYRALLPTTPLDASGRVPLKISGEGTVRNFVVWVRDRSFPTQRLWISGSTKATQRELDLVAAFKTLVSPEKLWNGAFLRPSQGRISTIYGVRRYYNGVFAKNYYHRGIDYAAGRGTPVVAPADGYVRLIGREDDGFVVHGNTVGLDHGQGVLSIFLHLYQIEVSEGQFVRAGDRIATIGSTGASTGPHLHWGLYVHGDAVDPVPWRSQGLF